MALRNDDVPPPLRRAPADPPQLHVDLPPETPILPPERDQNTRTPRGDMPPPSDPYLRRNAGIASPAPYERN
jgi:hypothetical protein